MAIDIKYVNNFNDNELEQLQSDFNLSENKAKDFLRLADGNYKDIVEAFNMFDGSPQVIIIANRFLQYSKSLHLNLELFNDHLKKIYNQLEKLNKDIESKADADIVSISVSNLKRRINELEKNK